MLAAEQRKIVEHKRQTCVLTASLYSLSILLSNVVFSLQIQNQSHIFHDRNDLVPAPLLFPEHIFHPMSFNSPAPNPFSTPPKCRPTSLMHLLCPQDIPPKRSVKSPERYPSKPGPPPPPVHPPALQVSGHRSFPIRVYGQTVHRQHGSISREKPRSERRAVDKKNLHLPRGERETPYQCRVCYKYYSRKDNLRAHARVHTGEKPFRCDICDRSFRWVGALRVHEKVHENGPTRIGRWITSPGLWRKFVQQVNTTTLIIVEEDNMHVELYDKSFWGYSSLHTNSLFGNWIRF